MTSTETRAPDPARIEAPSCGLPSEQVHAWLIQVQEDLRRVRARVEYLRAEEARLVSQKHLLAELLASSAEV